jgi:hypothetical protein
MYWHDLRDDPNLRRCSPAAKGLWAVHMLPAAAESPERGVVIINGAASRQQDLGALLCREIGETAEATQALVDELVSTGAASVNDQGRVYNRRMVREERLHQARAAAGLAGALAKHGKRAGGHGGLSAGGDSENRRVPEIDGWQTLGNGSGKGGGKPPGKGGGKQGGNTGGKTAALQMPPSAEATGNIRNGGEAPRWQTAGEGLAPSLPSHPSQFLTGADAPPEGDSDLDPTKVIFDRGLSWLRKTTDKTNDACRNILGRWRKQFDDDAELITAIGHAVRKGVRHPESWMQAVINARKPKATPREAWAEALP